MKKRPDVLKNFGERFSRLIKNPTQSKDKKPPKIKQKDLTKFMGCSESNIKEWKDGDWDIRLSNLYMIVEYIKKCFPDSNPMRILFSDLLADEIERIRQDSFDKGKDELDSQLEKVENKHQKELNKLQDQISALENEIKNIKDAISHLDFAEQAHLLFGLGKNHELAVKLGLTS